MASAQFHGQWQADLFWPCFGLAAALGVVLVSLRRPNPATTGRWLIGTLWLQAAGVFACLLGSGPGLALGVILVGTPFARKSVVWGKSVSVRIQTGGRRIIKQNTTKKRTTIN